MDPQGVRQTDLPCCVVRALVFFALILVKKGFSLSPNVYWSAAFPDFSLLLPGYIIYVAQPGATKAVGKSIHCLNGICSLNYTENKAGETCETGIGIIPMGTARPLGEGNNSTLCHSVGVHHGFLGCSQVRGEGERCILRVMSTSQAEGSAPAVATPLHCSWCTQHQKEGQGSQQSPLHSAICSSIYMVCSLDPG